MKIQKHALTVSKLFLGLTIVVSCNRQADVANGSTNDSTEDLRPANNESADATEDQQFFNRVALTDLKEIEVGKLAQQKRPGTPTAAFGQMLVSDHSASSQELKSLASKTGITLPSELDKNGKAVTDSLSGLQGKEFDTRFAAMMVDGHKEAIALMKEISEYAAKTEFRKWASEKIPVLESHLSHAEQLQQQVQKR